MRTAVLLVLALAPAACAHTRHTEHEHEHVRDVEVVTEKSAETEAVAAEADLPGDQLAALLATRARQAWRRTRFYRRLGAMLFGAAAPETRYRVFERFYRLDEGLIERFYAARSTARDKARVLVGKPPVPVLRALGALARAGPPLQGPGQ